VNLKKLLSTTLLTAVAGSAITTAAHAATAAASDNGGITEVTVTATKRSTNLQKTPIAISVLSNEALASRHVESLLDLADGAVPSLRVATFEARQSALTVGIRGIVPFDQNQTAREPGVGVYIDGIYLGRSQGLNAALFDVQRIEVLRGPQGTLFGRNTEGGALSIVTKDPTGVYGGRVSAGFGNYGSHTAQLHLNLPAADSLAFKIDGVQEHQDATVKNPMAGQAGWNQYDRTGGRISAKWTPTDKLTGVFSYDVATDENTPNFSQLINYNPQGKPVATLSDIASNGGALPSGKIAPLSPLVVVSGRERQKASPIGAPQQPSVDQTEGGAATFTYKLSPNTELKSITGYRRVTTDQWDNSGIGTRTVFLPNAKFGRYSLSFLRQAQVSQEFQLIGKTNQVEYVAGLYYFNEHVSEFAATPNTNQWNADGTAYTILSEVANGTITSGNNGWANTSMMFIQRDSHATATSTAAFGQLTYTPSGMDAFHLTVGGRYTDDKRDGALTKITGVATNYQLHYRKNRVDPLVIVAYDLSANTHVYAKYATGYRSGGANDRTTNFQAFGPESVKSYEAGFKSDMFDHHARLNLAVYQMDRDGTQSDFDSVDTNPFLPGTTTPNPNFNLHIENTGNADKTSKIKGLEAELLVKPTDNLTLGFNYAYTDVNVPDTVNPGLGTPFKVYTVYTPKNAASATVDYDRPLGGDGRRLEVHIDGNYADPQYSFQNQATKTDRSFVVNARIAIADIPVGSTGNKLAVALWSRNLLDTTYIYRRDASNAATIGDYGNFNPPRTVGIEVSASF
jgi:iron complex outermembrane receptor protein